MTRLLSRNFAEHFGTDFDPDIPTTTIAEDFSILATSQGRPCVFWHWGGIEEGVWDEHAREGTTEDIPANHTSRFAPAIQPTLRTGVEALCVAALTFLGVGGVTGLVM